MFCYKKIGLLIPLICSGLFGISSSEPEEEFFIKDIYCEPFHESGTNSQIHIIGGSTLGNGLKGTLGLYYRNSNKSGAQIVKSKALNDYTDSYTFTSSNQYTKNTGESSWEIRLTVDGVRIETHIIPCDYITTFETIDFVHGIKSKISYPIIKHYSRETGQITTENLDYNFNDFDDIVYLDSIGKFDLKNYIISSSINNFNVELEGKETYLKVPAIPGWFVDYSDQELSWGWKVFLLNIVQQENHQYYFTINEQLFINPNTLEMSQLNVQGSMQTEALFFPPTLTFPKEGFQCELYAKDFGRAHVNLVAVFYIQKVDVLLGDCITSEYCIKTSSAVYEDNIGKVLKND